MSTIAAPSVPPFVPPLMPALASDKYYEIINGQRREISPRGVLAGTIASILSFHLNAFALPRKLGVAVCEVLFRLRETPKLERRPDVAFIAYAALPNPILPAEDPASWDVVPKVAVEVVSPTNTADEVVDKMNDYFTHGVELVWVIYPRQRLIYAYQSRLQNQMLDEQGTLDGGAVIPGFQLKISDLFGALVKP